MEAGICPCCNSPGLDVMVFDKEADEQGIATHRRASVQSCSWCGWFGSGSSLSLINPIKTISMYH